jgi:hypothetical protein
MSRGCGFSESEVACLLEIIEEILPIGWNEWDRVTECHCLNNPEYSWTSKSLKHKFPALYNHKKPTGDPTCPPYMQNAKQILELIKAEMDVPYGEGDNGADGDAGEDIPDGVPLLPPWEN